MIEEKLANEIIKYNENFMVKDISHIACTISKERFPQIEKCNFNKLQSIMGTKNYIIKRVIDTKKQYIKDCSDPYNQYLIYRATIKI